MPSKSEAFRDYTTVPRTVREAGFGRGSGCGGCLHNQIEFKKAPRFRMLPREKDRRASAESLPAVMLVALRYGKFLFPVSQIP